MNKPSGISGARSGLQRDVPEEPAEQSSVGIDLLDWIFARHASKIASAELGAYLTESTAVIEDVEIVSAGEYVAALMGVATLEIAAAPLTALVLTVVAGYASLQAMTAFLSLASNFASLETSRAAHQVTNLSTLQGAAAASATFALTGDSKRALKNAQLANLIQKAGKFVIRGGFPKELAEKMATLVDITEIEKYEWEQPRAQPHGYMPTQSPQNQFFPGDGGYSSDPDLGFPGYNGPSCEIPSDNSGEMCSSF